MNNLFAWTCLCVCTLQQGVSALRPPIPPPGSRWQPAGPPDGGDWQEPDYDYKEVLKKSILFYEAQRSGDLPDTNRISWRGDSALHDHGVKGEDLSGGWYDSGGHVKNIFVSASTVTVIAWGMLQWWDAYKAAGQLDWAMDSIRWPLEYMLKSITKRDPTDYELYVVVGNPYEEDEKWGRPEDIPCCRPSYMINMTHPGSDAAGEVAAALAAGSIVFKEKDPCFSDELLQGAKDMFNYANFNRGKYSDAITVVKTHRPSHSEDDEIVWGAAWMYLATKNEHYLYLAEKEYNSKLPWAFDWDDKNGGYQILLYKITKKAKYRQDVQRHIDDWLGPPIGQIPYTPKGLAFRSEWGSLRHAANTAFLALLAANLEIKPGPYERFAIEQIHYILGDTGRSYVVGFGKNPPVKPHHAAASCDPDFGVPCGWSQFSSANGPNPSVIEGAVVGGPNITDHYEDLREDYKQNEVAVDYNAGFQSAIAGLIDLNGEWRGEEWEGHWNR